MNQPLSPAGYTMMRTLQAPDAANFLHCAIFLAQGRILDNQTFRLVRFEGQESVSELFEYQLELHGNTSVLHGAALEYEELIGRALTVGIQRPALHVPTHAQDIGYSNDEMTGRFRQALAGGGDFPELVLFNGIVASFAMEQRGVYRIGMKPALHRLTLTNDYKVYDSITAFELVRKLLRSQGIDYMLDALQDEDNQFQARRQSWMQAGESDYDFLRRLMAKAHVYFYFLHDGHSHTLVLANRPAYRPVFADDRPLRYTFTGADELGLVQQDVIFQYNYQRAMTSSSVRGVYTRQRACWEGDPIERLHSFSSASSAEPGTLPFTQYKIYQYGGSASQADEHVAATRATMQAAAQVFSGASYCAQFRAGHQFRVSGELQGPLGPLPVRPALDGQRFVLTQVKHEASADGTYQNQFQATPATALIGPFSMAETQQGSVLAEVVAPPNDGAPPDWRYYAAGCFDPATATLRDGKEALRVQGVHVRLSTDAPDAPPSFIKLAPHMQTMPEPGVTVVVARAQDEWELPEVQSIIHSDGTRVVMRSGWTAGSHVGSSFSTSYGDGKSLRFGLNSVAPLDFAVARVEDAYAGGNYREASYAQGAGYSYSSAESRAASASDNDELYGKYAGAADLLSASESFGSNYSRHHGDVVSSYSNIGTSYTRSVTGRSESDSTVTGDSTSKALHQGDVDTDTTHQGSVNSTTTILADSTSISTILGTNRSVATHAISLSNNNTGVQGSINTVGASNTVNLTGATVTSSVTGTSTENNSIGEHTTISVTGVLTTFSEVGETNEIRKAEAGIYYIAKPAQIGAEVSDIDIITVEIMHIFL